MQKKSAAQTERRAGRTTVNNLQGGSACLNKHCGKVAARRLSPARRILPRRCTQ